MVHVTGKESPSEAWHVHFFFCLGGAGGGGGGGGGVVGGIAMVFGIGIAMVFGIRWAGQGRALFGLL